MRSGISLLKEGYKMEFAVAICRAMILLYKGGIEDLLPKDIGSVSDVVYAPEYVVMRIRVTDKLKEIMKNNRADYEYIKQWISGQRRNSWCPVSCAVKYFLLQQRVKPAEDFENIYFFAGRSLDGYDGQTLNGLRKQSEKFFSNPNIERNTFENSIIMCKAFTAIALNKLELPRRVNHTKNTCTVKRGMQRKSLEKTPGYAKVQEGGVFSGPMKQGISDSVALGAPPPGFTLPFCSDVIEMELPFSRFHILYFLHPEFCSDNIYKYKKGLASQHECLCDMSKLPIKIRRISTQ
jgi:hypothetical protein